MKIAPVSGDMVIKLGLGLLALGGVAMVIYTVKSQASAAAGAVSNFAEQAAATINPSSRDNFVYSGFNGIAATVAPANGPGYNADGTWSLGAWLYDIQHPVEVFNRDNLNYH